MEAQYTDPIERLKSRYKGFNGYCGIHFDSVEDDLCVISCPLRPELLNPAGVAHGGLVATLTDVAAGLIALQADNWEHVIVTQNCSIHYLRPGTGDVMRAEARVIRKGRRVCVTQVDCFSGDGRLSATAIYEIAYLDPQ